ncbi:MAG: Hpt domain-containing protein, partial [Candidatus Competibacter sp.]
STPPAPLPASAVLDLATALGRLGNNEALLKKLLALFHQSEADTLQRIRQALAAGDRALAHRLAHTLKSTAGTVGANRLQAAARAIEQRLLNSADLSEQSWTELADAHAEVMAELETPDPTREPP